MGEKDFPKLQLNALDVAILEVHSPVSQAEDRIWF